MNPNETRRGPHIARGNFNRPISSNPFTPFMLTQFPNLEAFELEDDLEDNEINLEEVLKKTHLPKSLRDSLHRPESDWEATPSGEVCRNASTLVVDDIISKHEVRLGRKSVR